MSPSTGARIRQFARESAWLFLLDALAWAIGILAALVLRFDFDITRIHWGWTSLVIGITVVLQLLGGMLFWLYRGRYERGGFDEVRALVLDTVAVMAVAWGFAYIVGYGNGIPRSALIIAARSQVRPSRS